MKHKPETSSTQLPSFFAPDDMIRVLFCGSKGPSTTKENTGFVPTTHLG
jgi:hypothetical protein